MENIGLHLFNGLMNMFFFTKRCNLYNYADDNSIINLSPNIERVILNNPKHHCQNATQWFTDNKMIKKSEQVSVYGEIFEINRATNITDSIEVLE